MAVVILNLGLGLSSVDALETEVDRELTPKFTVVRPKAAS